jgi:excinuclease UvrABC nuclease subunit
MPIAARWRKLETLPPPRGRDALPGVYELADADKRLIYIGQSARDVPNRIRQHLQKNACVAENIAYWRYRYSRVPQAEEAALLTTYRQRHDALPPCNRATPRMRTTLRRYLERSRED